MKKFIAFTLGEVLIALSVIGVVASLVMPLIINGQKAATAQAQFNTAYSLLSKAITDMEIDNVSVEPSKYNTSGSFYQVFKNYNKVTIDCGLYSATNSDVCVSTTNPAGNYSRLTGTKFTAAENCLLDDGGFVLNNGMLVVIENPETYFYGLLILVDINGKNKLPNKLGYDLFAFELLKGGELQPVGGYGTGQRPNAKALWGADDKTPADYCNPDSDFAFNGITCAYFAASDENYFKNIYKNK